jgi:hypothetical protein
MYASEHVDTRDVLVWTWSVCTCEHMSIWTYVHTDMCTGEHANIRVVMYPWAYEYVDMCTYRHMYRWAHEHTSTWTMTHMSRWTCEHMCSYVHVSLCIFEHMYIPAYVQVNAWTYEYVWRETYVCLLTCVDTERVYTGHRDRCAVIRFTRVCMTSEHVDTHLDMYTRTCEHMYWTYVLRWHVHMCVRVHAGVSICGWVSMITCTHPTPLFGLEESLGTYDGI